MVALFQSTGGATEKHPVQTVSPLDTHSIFGTVTSHFIGRAISKEFFLNGASKLFHGRVKSHDAKRGYFLIQYEDGDKEELAESEVCSVRLTPRKKTKTKEDPHFDGDISRLWTTNAA